MHAAAGVRAVLFAAAPGTERKSIGLGLALVREIAHLHGGDAVLENRPEGGARAAFWVPEAS